MKKFFLIVLSTSLLCACSWNTQDKENTWSPTKVEVNNEKVAAPAKTEVNNNANIPDPAAYEVKDENMVIPPPPVPWKN